MTTTPYEGFDDEVLSTDELEALQTTAGTSVEAINQLQETENLQTQTEKEQVQAAENEQKPNPFSIKVDNPDGTFFPSPMAKTPLGRTLDEIGKAPTQGVVDTLTDTFNWVTSKPREAFNIPEIPKVGDYESGLAQGIRNASGLIIPALGLRGKLIHSATKLHVSGKAAPWLRNLGNSKSFAWLSKFGADVGTTTLVDYVAKQNQKNDNTFRVLKDLWPKTYQWIPNNWATQDGDSPDVKRSKNINEGAIFGLVGHVIEGMAFLTKAGKSVKRTTNMLSADPSNQAVLNKLTKDEFSDIKFSDNPLEDSVLRGAARKEKELDALGEYLKSRKGDSNEPLLGVHDVFDPKESVLRTIDPDGILGAATDAVQIQGNIQSQYGRLGSVITNAALKYGLEVENRTAEVLIKNLAETIKKGGKYTKKLAGAPDITPDMIESAGKKLTEILIDPRMEPGEMFKLLDEFKISLSDGSKVLDKSGTQGVMNAIKAYKDQLLDMDVMKARAYLTTSLAGQVADIAEGVRLMDDPMVYKQAIDQIADRMEYLMVEKALAGKFGGSYLRNLRTWETAKSTKKAATMNAAANAFRQEHVESMPELIDKAKAWTNTLREVAKTNPDFLKPLLLASELTDGNVDSLYKLGKVLENNLGTFSKAVYDGNPEMPSIINKQFMSTIYNNTLSAFATPIKALTGNVGGLIAKPATTLLGAGLDMDLPAMNRAMWAHFSIDDTFAKSFDHLKLVFKKVSKDPTKVSYVVRDDIRVQVADSLEVLRKTADAAEKNGEFGASALLNHYETLTALAQSPFFRYGANSMTALDGFSRAMLANGKAKYDAFDELVSAGKPVTSENLQNISNKIYNKMFDENGMIVNDAVDYMNSEIALNLDSPFVKNFDKALSMFPIARTQFMFPRTSVNILETFGKYSPLGIFAREYQQLWGPLALIPKQGRKLESFTIPEIKEVLLRHGETFDGDYMAKFKNIRYEVRGKVAFGSIMTGLGIRAAQQGLCTGTGHYNKSKQRSRVKLGWKKKHCKIPGTNKMVSYEFMGPLGDWLSTIVDIVDNSDLASTKIQEEWFAKSAFIIASSLTDRSVLSNFEPLNDILQGNEGALNQWAASFGNNLLPWGGLRNEFGRVMNPALRQYKGEFLEYFRNRNNWLDAFDETTKLPEIYDIVDGTLVRGTENMFLRSFNAYSPIKVADSLSPEKEWLVEAEYNFSPALAKSTGGAELENHEITALQSMIGKQGLFKKNIQRIMRNSKNITYKGVDYPELRNEKGFINILKAARKAGISGKDLDIKDFRNVYSEINKAFTDAKKIAEASLPDNILSAIREREYKTKNKKKSSKRGDIDVVVDLANE